MNDIDKIKSAGKEWVKGDYHRIYFNNLEKFYTALEINTYKTGSISSATLNGEKISNNRAYKIQTDLDVGKLYYDVKNSAWVHTGIDSDILEIIIENIKK